MDSYRYPRLSLDLLRGFRAAARHLSFTRAAQDLFVTQPAISRGIRTLEEQLGTPLFHRVNRTLKLTQAGEELYRAADEALALIDAATQRVAGKGRTLSITTTVPLASLWLAPRLSRFTSLHPEVDIRIAATDDVVDLERERVDVAIRHVLPGADAPPGESLVDYETFPVCSPRLARDRKRPLRTPADLAHHVLLDLETAANGRPWYDWQHWFDAMKLRAPRPAGSLRFSHYDHVVEAAIAGSGVAIGKRPHLARHLRDGTLVAPMEPGCVARLGSFRVIVAPAADREVVDAFVTWLGSEAANSPKEDR